MIGGGGDGFISARSSLVAAACERLLSLGLRDGLRAFWPDARKKTLARSQPAKGFFSEKPTLSFMRTLFSELCCKIIMFFLRRRVLSQRSFVSGVPGLANRSPCLVPWTRSLLTSGVSLNSAPVRPRTLTPSAATYASNACLLPLPSVP